LNCNARYLRRRCRCGSTQPSRVFPPPKDPSGKNKQSKGRSSRSTLSINGRIDLSRVRWYAAGEGSDSPVDVLLDMAQAVVTVGLRQVCCEQGIAGRSFARSVQNLKSSASIAMSEDLFRKVVESEGKAVLKASGQEQLELDWSAGQCRTTMPKVQEAEASPEAQEKSLPLAEVSRMLVSCDGVLVPTITDDEKHKRRATTIAKRRQMPAEQRRALPPLEAMKKGTDQRYKQIYVSIFYDQTKEHRLVGVTRKKLCGLAQLLRRDAARVHLLAADERLGLVDGAVCLRQHLEALPLQEVILDFQHLAEHVNDASRKTLGEATEAGKAFSDDVLHTARHEGYEPFFAKLLDWRTALRGGKRKIADQLLNYVAERKEMMPYDKCDQHGWDVGTGPMESMCGVTTDRIKGRGRRWDIDNAEAMMALEALQQSNLWDQYWDKALHHRN
jgi:hypothetical protein